MLANDPMVLVVESEEELRSAICDFLDSEHYRARGAVNVAAAREVIEHAVPALVLLSWDDPAEVRLRRGLLEQVPRMWPAVLMSIDPRTASIASEYRLAFLIKPFEVEALLTAVDRGVRSSESTWRPQHRG